jgi:hypothetical protein
VLSRGGVDEDVSQADVYRSGAGYVFVLCCGVAEETVVAGMVQVMQLQVVVARVTALEHTLEQRARDRKAALRQALEAAQHDARDRRAHMRKVRRGGPGGCGGVGLICVCVCVRVCGAALREAGGAQEAARGGESPHPTHLPTPLADPWPPFACSPSSRPRGTAASASTAPPPTPPC